MGGASAARVGEGSDGFESAARAGRARRRPDTRRALGRLRRSLTGSDAQAAREAVRLNGARVVRLTAAAVLAYLAAKAVTPDLTDLTGPLTALLVVQASLYGSLRSGVGRVASVLTGVLVALGLSIWFGLTWWSLGLAIGSALVLAHALRLGDHILETPISAMLVLGVTQHDAAAETRIVNTLVGAAVGMAFNLLVPPSVEGRDATAAVRAVARDLSTVLGRAAAELEQGFARSHVQGWLDDVHRVLPLVTRADEALGLHAERRRFNPRTVGAGDTGPLLRGGLRALDASTLAVRHTLISLIEEAPEEPPEGEDAAAAEAEALRGALGSVFGLMGEAVGAYGEFVASRAGGEAGDAESAFEQGLEALRETRAMLTELLLVDPAHDASAWLLHGSILGGVDRFLVALDLEPVARAAPTAPSRDLLTRRLLARAPGRRPTT